MEHTSTYTQHAYINARTNTRTLTQAGNTEFIFYGKL